MTEDEKRIWNKALLKVYHQVGDKYPLNSFGEQNRTASKIQSLIMGAMKPTKEGDRIFMQKVRSYNNNDRYFKKNCVKETIFIVLNLKGGRNGDVALVVCSFYNQGDADNFVKDKGHLTVISSPIE
jgi:hypothetical protein